MKIQLHNITAKWARAGAGFDIASSREAQCLDLERLLLDTARYAPEMARLFTMSITWLSRFGALIAKHRLRRLIADELESEFQSNMGLLLDIAQQDTYPLRFQSVINSLKPAVQVEPFFIIERQPAQRRNRAKRRASDISKRWGKWCEPIELKPNALRSAQWVMDNNPDFIMRADFKGDLRASVYGSLLFDKGAGDSELALSRAAGGSRAQTRSALDNLELTGRITRVSQGRKVAIYPVDKRLAA